jgi:hypothetical protein
VDSQAELFEIVAAFDSTGRLPNLLDRRHQQSNENGNDGDDHQQFNERKTLRSPSTPASLMLWHTHTSRIGKKRREKPFESEGKIEATS